MRREIFIAWAALAAASCAEPIQKASDQQPVVYGDDDRQDVYAYADPVWAARAAEVSAVMVSLGDLDQTNPGNVGLPPDTLQSSFNVCPDERFANQLTAGGCSATLIAPDLVLTAGHCISSCGQNAFVFDYYMTGATTLHAITSDDVYRCQQVVVREADDIDYAIVRLDRAVVGRTPATIATAAQAVAASTPIIVNGYPSGLPLKIDNGATVRDARAGTLDYFVANLDTFGGNSGSGVFRADNGQLVGILVRGETDYVTDGNCRRVNRCPNDGCRGEDSTYAFRAVDALCAAGPHPTLCHCGDGTCDAAAGETTATCAADCGSVCGDGACNGTESPVTCPQDCGTCGNQACDAGETPASCCTDCGCGADQVCRMNTCVPEPGPGDTCADAIVLTAQGTQMVQGTTATAFDDYAGSCVGSGANERVYSFTLTVPTEVDAALSGFDTGLYLRSTCDGASSQVACNDDFNPPDRAARITEMLAPGTYYLFADGYEDEQGNYELRVTFTPDTPACVDTDHDGTCDETDGCPMDPNKTAPGVCGCGVPDADGDSDGMLDCQDACPTDPMNQCNAPPPPPPPAPDAPDDDDAGGCGCRTGGDTNPAGGLVLIGAIAVALRRRRRA